MQKRRAKSLTTADLLQLLNIGWWGSQFSWQGSQKLSSDVDIWQKLEWYHHSNTIAYSYSQSGILAAGAETTLCLKNAPTLKRYSSKAALAKIIVIDFDDIWQKYSKVYRIEFACFSFHVGLLFV